MSQNLYWSKIANDRFSVTMSFRFRFSFQSQFQEVELIKSVLAERELNAQLMVSDYKRLLNGRRLILDLAKSKSKSKSKKITLNRCAWLEKICNSSLTLSQLYFISWFTHCQSSFLPFFRSSKKHFYQIVNISS